VSAAGDVNGDGVGDVIFAANNTDAGGISGAGEAYVVFGVAGGPPALASLDDLDGTNGFAFRGGATDDRLGIVAGAGNLNGDRFDDVIIGASQADPAGSRSGESFIEFRGPNDSRMARAAAGGTDFNADGRPDFVLGGVDGLIMGSEGPGSVAVVYGRGPAPCRADIDGDGMLTVFDFLAFQNLFDARDPIADFDGDGAFMLFDFLLFQTTFDVGCP